MTTADDADARRHPRTELALKVEYPDAEAFLQDYSENISRGGTFVYSKRDWSIGDRLRLTLSFPGLLKPIQLKGRVAWLRTDDDPGVGIEFLFDEYHETKRQLEDLITAIEQREQHTIARQIRVLVAEDNALIYAMIDEGIRRLACRRPDTSGIFSFTHAPDGARALLLVETQPFDVLIVDFHLPVLDGDTFIRRCRKLLGYELPIIAISGGGEEACEEALKAGADIFLPKPLKLVKVFETVIQLVGLEESSP